MDFALFAEIPVPKIEGDAEYRAYHDTLAQAIVADEAGFHSFWTVEHHFLKHLSHCSNPEVLYGAVAARTKRIRIGYGIRLMPKPYNHPVRTAESVAVLDLLSGGRVEFGIGRSATRPELEGFGIDPRETQAMALEALSHVLGCWTNDEYEFSDKYWSMPRRRVQPKPHQKPHPRLWSAAGTEDSHRSLGRNGLGVLSLAFGGLNDVALRMNAYRDGLSQCERHLGKFPNPRAGCFAMVHCAPTRKEAYAEAKESFEWYFAAGRALGAGMAEYLKLFDDGSGKPVGGYKRGSAEDQSKSRMEALAEAISFEQMVETGGCLCGDPDDVLAQARAYADAGVDLLMCLCNPYAIAPAKVEQSLRLIGEHVVPKLRDHPGNTASFLKNSVVPA